MAFSKNFLFWVVAVVSLVADQLTKYAVVQTMAIGQSWPLWPGVFHFTHVINRGAAFSLFQGEGWLRWLSLGVSLLLMGMAWWGPRFPRGEQLAYGMILAGALGNGIERFTLGYVTDFIDLKLINFAIFNWADVSINIGLAIYILTALWGARSISKGAADE
jgi:signal peptidase II